MDKTQEAYNIVKMELFYKQWYKIDTYKKAQSYFLRITEPSIVDLLKNTFEFEKDTVRVPAVRLIRNYEYKLPDTVNIKGGIFPMPEEHRKVGVYRHIKGGQLDLTKHTIYDIHKHVEVITIDVNKVKSHGWFCLVFPEEIIKQVPKTCAEYMRRFNADRIQEREAHIQGIIEGHIDYWEVFLKACRGEEKDFESLTGSVVYKGA